MFLPPVCPGCEADPDHRHTHPYVPGKKIEPQDMLANKEIWALLSDHYAMAPPGAVDGICACGDVGGWQADHLVALMVQEFGLPWKRTRRAPW